LDVAKKLGSFAEAGFFVLKVDPHGQETVAFCKGG